MRLILFLVAIACSLSNILQAAEFRDEVVRDFSLRSIGKLQITNTRGGLQMQGWALDKIRVKATRRVLADNPTEAKKLFSTLDFRYHSEKSNVELSAEYGRNLEIRERQIDRKQPRAFMDLVVFAPAKFKLSAWVVNGDVDVKEWRSSVEVRASVGKINIQDVKADEVSLLCPSCKIAVKNVNASLRCMGGDKDIDLEQVRGANLYIESVSGIHRATHVAGEQLYVSTSGAFLGRDLKGRIEFRSQSGTIDLVDLDGFVSGHTESGDIRIKIQDWKFMDKALLESHDGNITLTLPSRFSAEVDIWSVLGKTKLAFPLKTLKDNPVYGPEPSNSLRGYVGDGGEQLKIFSYSGDIQVLRGK